MPNLRLPRDAEEAELHYKPGPSAEWAELVVSADIEVFHEAALDAGGRT